MKKNFIPRKGPNYVLLQKNLDKLKQEVKNHGKHIDAISKTHDNHLTMLSNFAKHDIKNSVQSMDSIISTNTVKELTDEHIISLKLSLDIIRETIDNFSKLVPYSSSDKFEFSDLLLAVKLINRDSLYDNKIKLIDDSEDVTFTFNLPFQSVLQMINNIIINAIKAFDNVETNKNIKISTEYDNEFFYIKIFDNARKIIFNDIKTIFNYGVSSTGGSGIGLFHAKYLCNLYKGNIDVFELEDNNEYNKYFLITLPILKENI
jgi:signal transduction histidine kinase